MVRNGERSRSAARQLLLTLAASGLVACADGPEPTAEDSHDPSTRIRAVLGNAPPPRPGVKPASTGQRVAPGGGAGGRTAEPGDRATSDAGERPAPVLALHTGDTIHLGAELAAFYQQRDFAPAWTGREGFLVRTDQLLEAVLTADREGLDTRSYQHGAIHDLVERARHDHDQGLPVGDVLGTLDMLLTESFLRVSTDLARGALDPAEAELSWSIPREDPTGVGFLNATLDERNDLEEVLHALRPATPFYGQLRKALARYRAVVEAGGWPAVSGGDVLEEGSEGARVLQLRARLQAEGDRTEAGLLRAPARPELYDAELGGAVEHFQARHGLEPDGAVGAATLEALGVPAEERLLALTINLDRWRWLPRELGDRYVLVNVAGFRMAVMEDHRPALSMNVVVGQDAWRTPIFRDTMEFMVVNPYWNVPNSIAHDELLPRAARDPGYFARNDYEVVYRDGEQVIRQRPGPGNALGKVKFLFPNSHDVYLHDTPADHLFSRASRAFSHGCIRLENPEELARYLLRTSTSRPERDFDRMVASGREQWVRLDEKVPVYILYFTAWADEDGTVSFYDDIYRRDAEVKRHAAGSAPGGVGYDLRGPGRSGPP
jgi:L,D-transpeptidase YcbB